MVWAKFGLCEPWSGWKAVSILVAQYIRAAWNNSSVIEKTESITLQTSNMASAEPLIVVMGVTGAGKSHFINTLAGRQVVKTGTSLNPCEFCLSMVLGYC